MSGTSDNGNPATELWAGFFEAQKDGKRTQWMLVAPALDRYAATGGALNGRPVREGMGLVLKRRIEKPGHRAKWSFLSQTTAEAAQAKVNSDMEQYASTGFKIMHPVVIAIDLDDYQDAWRGKTPYKAFRHVEAVTKKRGYRLIDA